MDVYASKDEGTHTTLSSFFATDTDPIMDKKNKEVTIMKQLDLKPVWGFVKGVCKFAGYGLLIASRLDLGSRASVEDDNEPVGYYDVVDAIVDNNGMLDSSKMKMIAVIDRDGDADYYRTVMRIAKNNGMLDSNKIEFIKNLPK